VIQKRESKAQCLLGSGFEVTHYHFHHHLSIRSKLLNPIHIPREENQKAQCSENQMHFTETKKQHKLTQNLAFRGAAAIRFTSKAFSGDWPGRVQVRSSGYAVVRTSLLLSPWDGPLRLPLSSGSSGPQRSALNLAPAFCRGPLFWGSTSNCPLRPGLGG